MPSIDIPADLQARLEAFRPVVNEVLEADVSFEDRLKIVIERGLDTVLADLLGAADASVLLARSNVDRNTTPKRFTALLRRCFATGKN